MEFEGENVLMKCNKPIEGYTVGKKYNLLGCVGEYIVLIADNGEQYTVHEGYFDIVSK
ncbi:hypothetical protein [Lacrimispora algidixylanolytica]|uniref:hypothetical protein n=1 Tax=Lacrimispora algidixylanolytica TaxID=94868 RepID=UPI001313E2F3|nr:hypothetical protein [Lacrimispora algidixylanolytica]